MLRLATALLLVAAILPAQDDLDRQMKSVIDAYSIVEHNASDPVSSEQAFYQGAIPGLLRRLDPHSIFFDPGQFEQVKKMEASTQKGFGSVVSLLPGRVIVLQTTAGTPSAKAGLAPGDEILAINGYIISRLDLDQLTELLSQSRQQQAQLDVRRPGANGMMRLVLTPVDMQAPSVERAFFLAAGIGYVRVSSFDGSTGADIKKAIEKLGGNRLAGLVLDLRNNPGGVVTAALETASLFLQPGTKIVTVRGRSVPETSETVPSIATPYGFKLAILVNAKSASASEIVSGAMQDHDRATIVGEPTYGKGLVQSVFPLTQNTGLALTTALYYTPSGRSIQKPLDAAKFELAATTAHPNAQSEFHTDKGRPVTGGGGIRPDFVVYPPPMNRLRAVMDASGSFTNFATEYLRSHKIETDFEVTPQVLAEFQVFLADRNIQPSVGELSLEQEFMKNRLKTEIFNQAFGVEKGDEVEAQRDPVIQKALEVVGS
ncbi:C-terminal processing peptidase-3. Serine peptidase. MEROPS family S41A [Candidatus Sulfopaludibacter sp. SbA4]|nr:C-terminal processing peptidase-3. Serine peptidase. MEROPS family S41A [Candidatus Sulfopaludibacter sp. SbA4]